MVLSEADKAVYFPLVLLTGLALQGAIQAAQTTAETIAGRPLELTQFTESHSFAAGSPFEVSSSRDLTTRYRPYSVNRFYQTMEVPTNREIPLRYQPVALDRPIVVIGDGKTLLPDDYLITQEGFIVVRDQLARKLQITYWAGFNFNIDSPEVRSIKSAVASILNYQTL